jgi:hypothetical protein
MGEKIQPPNERGSTQICNSASSEAVKKSSCEKIMLSRDCKGTVRQRR